MSTSSCTRSDVRRQFGALLVAAHRMNAENRTLARFVGSCRVDISRHDDLRRIVRRRVNIAAAIVGRRVDTAVATGEIEAAQADQLAGFVRTVLTDLTDALSNDVLQHQAAIDAIQAIVAGTFLRPVKGKPRVSGGQPRRRALAPRPVAPIRDVS